MPNRIINARQLEVLRWIGDGCPGRGWPDESHKHSARALAARGLAAVRRPDGVWTATLTDAGRYYLANGDYPSPSRSVTAQPRPQSRRSRARSTVATGVPKVIARPLVELGPSRPKDADLLLGRLLRAREPVLLADANDQGAAKALEAGHPAVPPGERVCTSAIGYRRRYAYLAEDAYATTKTREVVVPDRVAKLHSVAQEYRAESDHHQVSKNHLPRAVRIVHALARAFDEAAIAFAIKPQHGSIQFLAGNGPWQIAFRLQERGGGGGGPIPFGEKWSKQPLWLRRRNTQFVSTGILVIDLGYLPGAPPGTRSKFSDGKAQVLDALLPQVVRQIEAGLRHRTIAEEQDMLCDALVEAAWRAAIDKATVRADLANRSIVLAERAAAWRQWRDQSDYLDQLEATLDGAAGASEEMRTWIDWSRQHLDTIDPLLRSHAPPSPLPRTEDVLRPHLNWVGPLRQFS